MTTDGEDVDDDGCVMLDEDKENVDTANLRPLSQLDGDLDDIEDDESPSNHHRTSHNPAPSPPPLRFGNKRQTQSTGDVLHTPHKTTSKPLLPQFSACSTCLPSVRVRTVQTAAADHSTLRSHRLHFRLASHFHPHRVCIM